MELKQSEAVALAFLRGVFISSPPLHIDYS